MPVGSLDEHRLSVYKQLAVLDLDFLEAGLLDDCSDLPAVL